MFDVTEELSSKQITCSTRQFSHVKNIRSATLMLVFVTCTYLASNMLNVIVYTWELIDKPSLMSEKLRPFYTLSSDLVSLLTVLARHVVPRVVCSDWPATSDNKLMLKE
ncbi:hypothetical protein DICVIV_04482 [Dictyocaulus viviparus]|uniref:G-protein coupled receptors family 1 profile domain-containing protein n=1 Tax=Dictyocaulus viviparus TaxID=29172 RepID=A0A0D8Y045_DICVI|nr:hypothetical protein DICVIV_04482 [Dictyocaulus viviparus]